VTSSEYSGAVSPARTSLRLLAVLAAAVLAGCGSTTVEREPSLVAGDGDGATTTPAGANTPRPSGVVRIAVVTHGQASSPFWAIVRNGVESAARQMDVLVDYRAPDVYSVDRMRELIDRAIAGKPDGLVVSLPEPGVAPAVERAVRAGIPVVSINSGSMEFRRLGVLAHVGQIEDRAGFRAGQRFAREGVRRALCVIQQAGNVGLEQRCQGLARAMRRAGGTSIRLVVNDQSASTPTRIGDAVRRDSIDGVLALNSTAGMQAVQAVGEAGSGRVKVATFDLGPEVLRAVQDGRLTFAVDQQAYLQGYLPVIFLTERARYGLFPAQGDIVATGPNFVTRDNADKALELSRRSIR
jgi:simple sugar transport system substrate-binding protein